MSGVPYIQQVEVECVSDSPNCVELPAPYRGHLRRLIVVQVDGSADGFSYDLYDRFDACGQEIPIMSPPSTTTSTTTTTNAPWLEPEFLESLLHKLQDTQTVAAASMSKEQYSLDLSYINRDEQDPITKRPTPALYMDVRPAGSGVKTFRIAYTIDGLDL
jgi:hypothetical protein